MAIHDTLIHEIDVFRWLLDDDYVSARVTFPRSCARTHQKLRDPQIVAFRCLATLGRRRCDFAAFGLPAQAHELVTRICQRQFGVLNLELQALQPLLRFQLIGIRGCARANAFLDLVGQLLHPGELVFSDLQNVLIHPDRIISLDEFDHRIVDGFLKGKILDLQIDIRRRYLPVGLSEIGQQLLSGEL
jgi:hypothetical protein